MSLTLVGNDLTFGSFSNSARPGPYLYSGVLFGVVFDISDSSIKIVRSIDDGDTWEAVGAGIVVPDESSFGCDIYNNVIYVAHSATGSDEDHWKIAISRFNMSTQLWVGTDESTIETPANFAKAPDLLISWYPILITCRGVNDCVVTYINPWALNRTGAWIARWNGSWQAPQKVSDDEVGESYMPTSISNGINGVQIIYQTTYGISGNKELRLKTLASDNTIGSYIVVAIAFDDGQALSAGAFNNNGILLIPFNYGRLSIAGGLEWGPFNIDTLSEFNVTPPTTDSGGYQISFADLYGENFNNISLIWIPDEGDIASYIRKSNKVNGVWQAATTLYTAPGFELGNPADVFMRKDSKPRIFFRISDGFIFCVPSRNNSKIYYYDEDGFEISVGDSFTLSDSVSSGDQLTNCEILLQQLDPHTYPAVPLQGVYDGVTSPLPSGPVARTMSAPCNSGDIYNISDDQETLDCVNTIYVPTE